jgi:hypothetical protein
MPKVEWADGNECKGHRGTVVSRLQRSFKPLVGRGQGHRRGRILVFFPGPVQHQFLNKTSLNLCLYNSPVIVSIHCGRNDEEPQLESQESVSPLSSDAFDRLLRHATLNFSLTSFQAAGAGWDEARPEFAPIGEVPGAVWHCCSRTYRPHLGR